MFLYCTHTHLRDRETTGGSDRKTKRNDVWDWDEEKRKRRQREMEGKEKKREIGDEPGVQLFVFLMEPLPKGVWPLRVNLTQAHTHTHMNTTDNTDCGTVWVVVPRAEGHATTLCNLYFITRVLTYWCNQPPLLSSFLFVTLLHLSPLPLVLRISIILLEIGKKRRKRQI